MKKNNSLKTEIHNKIYTEILTGNFPVNSIITEKQLIEMFQVSKTTIREALVELGNEKVLESMPRYGYRIVQLDQNDIEEAIEARLILELSSFDRIVPRFNDDWIQKLKDFSGQSDKTRIRGDIWTHWNNNLQFHLLLNSFSGNAWVKELLEKTLKILGRAYAQCYWNQQGNQPFDLDIVLHHEFVANLEKRQFNVARQKLEEDILAFRAISPYKMRNFNN
ncbi:hypothetical protein A8F94_08255 [Bacillus sp. FJAT-27225]|uniref:GntR family transcriptional regulator n=1 Tax=Bacillus sp. FJAT-27225 TaxID=1743144 RepID=UPI00080C3411|nr:GntR family transcriptional regulator [Bacillus sp. FJAT-27225]OCA87826.1 hypothetical protein A8F94_08255 [Bacillus sp. FJAT-27225]